MDAKRMVLTAIGPDRPGIVKAIASSIHESGANLEDSRMAVLAGDFALIVLFSGDPKSIVNVQESCRALEKELHFQITFKTASTRHDVQEHKLYKFIATGVDQPGIVHMVSAILADLELNVVSLESRLANAAFHGTSMFTMAAEIQIEKQGAMDKLVERLDRVCDELDLGYDLEAI